MHSGVVETIKQELPKRLEVSHRTRRRLTRAAAALTGILLTPALAACQDTQSQETTTAEICGLHDGLYTQLPDANADRSPSDFMNDLVCSIDDTPAGESIKISTYKLHNPVIADALLRAHQRGVDVQIVMDDNKADNRIVRTLQQQLGSDTSEGSFINLCDASCLNPGKGVQHAKVIAFSHNHQTVVGSTNLSGDNLYETSGIDYATSDSAVYDTSVAFVDSLNHPASSTTTPSTVSGPLSISFSPYSDPRDEPIGELLDQVKCQPVDGQGENTQIDIAMYDITWGRRKTINRLAALASSGCDLRMIINGKDDQFQAERANIAKFLAGKGASMIYPPKDGLMVHDKLVLVAGNIDGRYQQVTTLGSQNLTGNALKTNTEATLQSHKPEDYQQALNHFNQLYEEVDE